MNNEIWYFSYGSNMFESKLLSRVGKFKDKKVLFLDGYELCFNKSNFDRTNSYANIREKNNSVVYGVGYLLSNAQIKKLDIYEGCDFSHYFRKSLCCRDSDNNTVDCQVYIACSLYINNNLRPTRKYIDLLLDAKDILPEEYVKKIEEAAKI